MSILLLQEEILVINMTPHSCCQRSSKGYGSTVYCAGARARQGLTGDCGYWKMKRTAVTGRGCSSAVATCAHSTMSTKMRIIYLGTLQLFQQDRQDKHGVERQEGSSTFFSKETSLVCNLGQLLTSEPLIQYLK